ncbi:hypothetical protein ABZ678_32205 [Streptomyces hirsutus]
MKALPDDYRTGLGRRRSVERCEEISSQHHRERAVRQLRDAITPS